MPLSVPSSVVQTLKLPAKPRKRALCFLKTAAGAVTPENLHTVRRTWLPLVLSPALERVTKRLDDLELLMLPTRRSCCHERIAH